MTMSTNSYLEFYLSLLAWIINNGIWNTLVDMVSTRPPLPPSSFRNGSRHGSKALTKATRACFQSRG